MPNFLYTVIVLAIGSWAFLIHYMNHATPDTSINKVLFCLYFFVTTTTTLSLALYVIQYKKAPKLVPLKKIYRAALRDSIKVSLIILVPVILRVFEFLNGIVLLIYIIAAGLMLRNSLKRRRF